MTEPDPLPSVHVCSFTDFADVTLRVDGKAYRMDFSTRFGPTCLLDSKGRERPLPGVRKDRAFWDALQCWCQQGHRLTPERECIWEDTRTETRWWSPDGRNFVLDTPENRREYASFVRPGKEQTLVVKE